MSSVPSIAIEVLGPAGSVDVEAGSRLTRPFTVVNASAHPIDVNDHIAAPMGWGVIADAEAFTLQPGERRLRLITLVVPGTTGGGVYDVTYSAVHTASGASSTGVLQAVVPRVEALQIAAVQSHLVVAAGDAAWAEFIVSNTGNVSLDVLLEAEVIEGWSADVEPRELALAPRQAQRVRARVAVPRRLQQSRSARLVVRGYTAAGTATAEGTARIEALPRMGGADVEYHRFPMRVGFGGGAVQDGTSWRPTSMLEINGGGYLDENEHTRVAFDVTAPVQGEASGGLYTRDRYHFALEGRHLDFWLGDLNYRTGRLTNSLSGAGAGTRVRLGAWADVGGAYAKRRHGLEGEAVTGHVGLRPFSWARLEGAYLHRAGVLAGELWSGGVTLSPMEGLEARFEYGRGGDGRGQQGEGWTAQVTGRTERAGASAEYTRIGSGLPTYFAGRERVQLRSSFRFRPQWSVSASGLLERRAAHVGTTRSALYRYHVRGQFSRRFRLNVSGQGQPEGYQAGRAFHRSEATADLVQSRWTRLALTAEGSLSRVPGLSASFLGHGYGMALNQRVTPQTSLSVSARMLLGGADFTGDGSDRRTYFGHLGLRSRLGEAASVQLSVHSYYYQTAFPTHAHTATVRLEYTLPWKHEVRAQGYYRANYRQGWTGQAQVYVSYAVPLDLRLFRNRKKGLVMGRVLDADTNTGIAGVPVRLDEYAAITNDDGEFFLRGIEAGRYTVRIEPERTAYHDLRFEEPTATVVVTGGRWSRVAFEARRTASISGRIDVAQGTRFTDSALAAGSTAMAVSPAGVAVEIWQADGGTPLHQFTSADGRFSFAYLPEGTYTIRVRPETLPPRYTVEMPVHTLQLGANERRDLVLTLVPQPRKMRMMSDGVISLAANTPNGPSETETTIAPVAAADSTATAALPTTSTKPSASPAQRQTRLRRIQQRIRWRHMNDRVRF